MGLEDDQTDDKAEQRYEDLCSALNLDKNAKEEAWESFQRISENYTLEVSFMPISCGSHVCFDTPSEPIFGN